MKLQDIKKIAKQQRIIVGKKNKDELIRSIQRASKNFDCFGNAIEAECSLVDCVWRENCLT